MWVVPVSGSAPLAEMRTPVNFLVVTYPSRRRIGVSWEGYNGDAIPCGPKRETE